VNHRDCIAILLKGGPRAPEHQAAEEHVAGCSDCWSVISLVHELAMGTPPEGAERMAGLFGCAPVQDEMYLLADLSAADIRTRYPAMAAHLGWCAACRERAAEVLAVERAAARGEFAVPASPGWREIADRVREAVGRAVVQLRRAGAVFTAVPDGFVLSPGLAPALRGGGDLAGAGRQVEFSLGESGLWAEITLEAQGAERVGLAVRVTGAEAGRLSLHLREVRDDGAELVARHPVPDTGPVVVSGLAAGRYLLEIEEKSNARRYQLRFDVEPSA
jgi:hypothetical protein